MFKSSDVIDNKYTVINVLSDQGGMGQLLKVVNNEGASTEYALKYCRKVDAESLDRFRREVRMMKDFAGNSKVVQIAYDNLNHTPPYFVMPIYAGGDLSSVIPSLKDDLELQEKTLLRMTECVGELHKEGKHHRDIKPANFLLGDHGIVISDLGLGMDNHSRTGMTVGKAYGGTYAYIPPEFITKGFRDCPPQSDIFMLGKSFYNILTDLDPQFIDNTILPNPLLHLIERCCMFEPTERYNDTDELKQAIVGCYDILLKRLDLYGDAKARYTKIENLLKLGQYDRDDFEKFISIAVDLEAPELFNMVGKADKSFFYVLSQQEFTSELEKFLDRYDESIRGTSEFLDFGYAEHIADNMKVVFDTSKNSEHRVKALSIAVSHADRFNRYSAMSTCSDMICNIEDGDGVETDLVSFLVNCKTEFLDEIEPSSCKNPLIISVLRKRAKRE